MWHIVHDVWRLTACANIKVFGINDIAVAIIAKARKPCLGARGMFWIGDHFTPDIIRTKATLFVVSVWKRGRGGRWGR